MSEQRTVTQFSDAASVYHRFWFAPTDPIVVSVLRLFVGGMLLYTMLVWGLELHPFFLQNGGWQSRELVEQLAPNSWAVSFLWHVPDSNLTLCHVLCTAIIFAFWIGLATPVTKWLAAAIIISYANRVPLANYGLDQINTVLTLYLCVGPCGARLSADQLIKSLWRKFRDSDVADHAAIPSVPSVSPVKDDQSLSIFAGLSIRLVQVHLCIIYFWAGLSKLQGVSWWNGQAVWRAASNFEYQQVPLTWLADFPWLFQMLSIGTWVWEISFLFLVWNRYLRWPVLLVGLSMHIGIGMFMGMWTFGLIMCFAYIAFLPASLLNRLVRRNVEDDKAESTSLCDASAVSERFHEPSSSRAFELAPRETQQQPTATPRRESTIPMPLASARGSTKHIQRGSIVIFVEPDVSARHKMTKALHRLGYQCIGVDGWPEAIEIFNGMEAHAVLCNASRLQYSELMHWVDCLRDHPARSNASPKCIALYKPQYKNHEFNPDDEQCVLVPFPIQPADLGAILEGHVPLHLQDRLLESIVDADATDSAKSSRKLKGKRKQQPPVEKNS